MTLPSFHGVNNRDTGTPRSTHVPQATYEEYVFSIATFNTPRTNYTTVFSGTSSAGCTNSAFSSLGFSGVNPATAIIHAVKGVGV